MILRLLKEMIAKAAGPGAKSCFCTHELDGKGHESSRAADNL
jgi:hypothetical protein